jgi:serine phosphatase RsbU (regulator of sigma subunit)
VIGLIYVDSQNLLRQFTEEDLTLLTVMANIAAIRIENERLAEVEQAEIIMKKELEQAAEIQRNLLPRHAPPVEGLELAAFSYPCRSVGGDYFDYLKMAGGRLGLIVGDVAGKGLAAALLMSSLQARVQVLIEEPGDVSMLMGRLNASVARTCPGNRFVTFFLCSLDPVTGELSYTNAGHNPPYLVRAATGDIEQLTAGGPVLGILPAARYQSAVLKMEPGDVLVMFSDVTGAQSPSGEYGEDRSGGADQYATRSWRHFEDPRRERGHFMGTAPAADDITLVVAEAAVTIEPPHRWRRWRGNLNAVDHLISLPAIQVNAGERGTHLERRNPAS